MIDEVPVENGKDADAVQLMAEKDVNTIVPAGLDKSAVIIRAVDKPESVQAPVEKDRRSARRRSSTQTRWWQRCSWWLPIGWSCPLS